MSVKRSSGRFHRLALAAALGAVGLATVGLAGGRLATAQSATATPTSAACRPATPAAGAAGATAAAETDCLALRTFDIYFDPNLATIPADKPVTVQVQNDGRAVHNFSITDHKNPNVKNLDISVTMNPGEEQTATVDAPAGTYYFFCNQPGHEQGGMFGYLTVAADGTIEGTLATVTPPAGS